MFNNLISWLQDIWSVYTIIAYTVSILFLVLYVYASTHKRRLELLLMEQVAEQERIYNEHYRGAVKSSRINDILKHIDSDNPNDWKLAIIEADIILDEALKKAGYGGTSLGERLKSISPNQLNSLDFAWQAHKVRNQIAHAGADFVLTHRLAEETIKKYKVVFNELEIT